MKEKRKWMGTWPANCDICKTPLSEEEKFYDAKTDSGRWGLLCPLCFSVYAGKLGTGFGQEYNSKTLEKIGG